MTRYHEPHHSWTRYGFDNDIPAEDLRAMQDRFDHEFEAAGNAHRVAVQRGDWLERWGIPLALVVCSVMWVLIFTWLIG